MARRNSYHRLRDKQAALLISVQDSVLRQGDDSAMLQQGSPVSSLQTYASRVSMRGPNFKPLDAKAPAWYLNGAKPTFQGDKGKLTPFKPRKGDFTL